MNVLITGATGFIVSHLKRELCKKWYHCRCLVRNVDKAREIFKEYKKIEFVIGDVTKPDSLRNISNNIHVVYHLAALGHVTATSVEAYQEFREINVGGTENLIKNCISHKIKFFHFSSTAAMGLIKDIVVDETVKPQPITPYQKSKLESEKIIEKYIKKIDFPGVIYRPCMIYGVGGFGEFYKFAKLIKKGLMPRIGFQKKLTPIVNVKDVVQACIKGIENAKIQEVYFICGSMSYPFDEICRLIAQALNIKRPFIYTPEFLAIWGTTILERFARIANKIPIVTTQNIRSTVANRIFSIDKARKDFDYEPRVELKDGIKETIEWYKNNGYIRT